MCDGHYVIVTFDRDLSSADICNANWMTKVSVQSSVLSSLSCSTLLTGLRTEEGERDETELSANTRQAPGGFLPHVSVLCLLLWSNTHYNNKYSSYGTG